MNKLVSIILPVFNGESYLTFAIDSVLKQTYSKFKLIIINDGSFDNTEKIIYQYLKIDSRIVLINNKKNIGIVDSLNLGLKISEGDYIARIDDDDIWNYNKLENQINYLSNNPNIDLLASSVEFIDEKNNIIKPARKFNLQKKIYHKEIINNIIKRNLFCHSSVIIKKEVISDLDNYNNKYRYCEDYELWINLLQKYHAEISNEKLVKFRINHKYNENNKNRIQQFNTLLIKKKAIKSLNLSSFNLIYLIPNLFNILLIKVKLFITKYSSE